MPRVGGYDGSSEEDVVSLYGGGREERQGVQPGAAGGEPGGVDAGGFPRGASDPRDASPLAAPACSPILLVGMAIPQLGAIVACGMALSYHRTVDL